MIIELQLVIGGSLLGVVRNIRDWDRWPVVEKSTVNNRDLSHTGWWFGTFFIFPYFPYIGNFNEFHHPNWLIFFRGVAQPPTRLDDLFCFFQDLDSLTFDHWLQSIAQETRNGLRVRNIGVWNLRLPPGLPALLAGEMRAMSGKPSGKPVNLPFGSIGGCFYKPPIYGHSGDG